jgi:hypothetical protein
MFQELITKRTEQCQMLVKTEKGRLELLKLMDFKPSIKEFSYNNDQYDRFCELPYKTLYRYYCDRANEIVSDQENKNNIITQSESDEFRKLLSSGNSKAKENVLNFIDVSECDLFIENLLQMCLERELVKVKNTALLLSRPNEKIRTYHYRVFQVLAKLGNQQTINTLNQFIQSKKLSREAESDAQLAIDCIKLKLEEEKEQERYQKEQEKLIVTGKLANIEGGPGDMKMNPFFIPPPEKLIDQNSISEIDNNLPKLIPHINQKNSRTWTSREGWFAIEAALIKKNKDSVVLRCSDETEITVPIDRLSNRDQTYIKEWIAP